MKFIGLLEEHENNLPFVSRDVLFSGKQALPGLQQILAYLSEGYCIAGTVETVYDIFSEDCIDSLNYRTDGEYVWPVYLAYYLQQYPEKVSLPEDFIAHLASEQYQMQPISKKALYQLENEFADKWSEYSLTQEAA